MVRICGRAGGGPISAGGGGTAGKTSSVACATAALVHQPDGRHERGVQHAVGSAAEGRVGQNGIGAGTERDCGAARESAHALCGSGGRTFPGDRAGLPDRACGGGYERWEESAQQERVQEALRNEARLPFDLMRGPLLRVKLLRLGAEDHVLLRTMHHIVSDGWSEGVFNHELMVLYEAFWKGERIRCGR